MGGGLFLAARLVGDGGAHGVAVRESRAACRANHGALQIIPDVGEDSGIAGVLLVFQRPLLDGTVNLAQVVDARVHLGLRAGAHEVGNRDRREEADDGHDDHDFNEGEARLA